MNKIYIISLTLIFNFKLFSTQHIAPEISNAFKQLNIIMQTNLSLYQKPDKNNCLIEDNISVIEQKFPIKKLNQDTFWFWNQSKAKAKKEYQDYQVVIRKYSPRKKFPNEKDQLPQYKLWKYELFKDDNLIKAIFWTEKGKKIIPEQIINNKQKSIEIEIVPVNLADLTFLEEFMEPSDALNIFF